MTKLVAHVAVRILSGILAHKYVIACISHPCCLLSHSPCQVVSDTPAFTWSVPASFRMRRRVLTHQHALSCCSNIHALRTFGSSTAMGGLLPQQLQGLQQLQALSVYGVGPAVELLGISRLTQLTALSLTFELPDKRSGQKLVGQVGSLPLLQQLALPAKLLCGTCCPGATVHLQVRACIVYLCPCAACLMWKRTYRASLGVTLSIGGLCCYGW